MKKILVQDICEYLMLTYELSNVDTWKVLNTYSEVLKDTLTQLQSSVRNEEIKDAELHAHSLKGALLNLGLENLAQEASRLEQDFRVRIEKRHLLLVDSMVDALKDVANRSPDQGAALL